MLVIFGQSFGVASDIGDGVTLRGRLLWNGGWIWKAPSLCLLAAGSHHLASTARVGVGLCVFPSFFLLLVFGSHLEAVLSTCFWLHIQGSVKEAAGI